MDITPAWWKVRKALFGDKKKCSKCDKYQVILEKTYDMFPMKDVEVTIGPMCIECDRVRYDSEMLSNRILGIRVDEFPA